jgi:trans-2,3-dihydro-3-hydroxyanthranilate isomerase
MSYRFFIVDVFTTRPFGGNQLSVFPDAEGLAPTTMQALAREFNFAETTFVVPATDRSCLARVRIFTPGAELPFAGHPTIGTTAVLAALGRITSNVVARLEEGVGPVAVLAGAADGALVRAGLTLEPRLELPAQVPARDAVARALSLSTEAVEEAVFAGVGLPFCLVRLTDRQAVDRAVLDRAAWATAFDGAWSGNLFLYAGETSSGSRLYARMFAPALGIEEDPATGSAAATLAAMLGQRYAEATASLAWQIEQGVRMGRPSLIEVTAEKRDGRVASVSVAGHSVIVGEGEMRV